MVSNFTYFDTHTHKKYRDTDVIFIRNAFHHLKYSQLSKLNYFFSVGIHPWDTHKNYQNSINHLTKLAAHPNCRAIGECGLDYFIKTDRELQKKVFQIQIAIAEEFNKPLIIHCVRAYQDLIPLIKNKSIPIVLHQYQGSIEVTKSILSDHIYFSFGKQLFRENFNEEVLEIIPKTHLLFETDIMPIHIEEVYLKASSILDVELDDLKDQINNNSQKVFLLNFNS